MTLEHQKTLESDGIVILDSLVSHEQLRCMQEAFAARLRRLRFSDVDGYERTELYRRMVQDVLTLDQGFVDLALHPTVLEILRAYLGDGFRLTEAKGWRSLATRRDFHGWHGDAWYDQQQLQEIPREVKLAFYLTDVDSGEFQYVRGSHRQRHPRPMADSELTEQDCNQICRAKGPAGTAILFDTSGIHRQGTPNLRDRDAIFLNYHDPRIPLQDEDVAYYRYHPLLLNAAFLGDLSPGDQQILGFGDRSHYLHAFQRSLRFPGFQRVLETCWGLRLRADDLWGRIRARLPG
jgi:hypothetical protein